MKNYLGFILTHGDLAYSLKNVMAKLMPFEIPFHTYSNNEMALEYIVNDMEKNYIKTRPEKVIIFIDLMGGSCWHAAMGFKKNHSDCAIVTGANIPGLVSFATNFSRLEWPELLIKIEEDARKAIKVV